MIFLFFCVFLLVYHQIKAQIMAEQWNADELEEFEDSEGRVMTKRVYEDMARQGLL